MQSVKADSHITCRAHGVPRPCRLCKGSDCLSHFELHGAAVSDSHLPCNDRTMPFVWRPRHSTSIERRPVVYLSAFAFFRLPRGVPRSLLSEAYQETIGRCEKLLGMFIVKLDMPLCCAVLWLLLIAVNTTKYISFSATCFDLSMSSSGQNTWYNKYFSLMMWQLQYE